MKKIDMEVFDDTVNSAVIRLPERNFPGILIQGDSLWILYETAVEAKKLCEARNIDETLGSISELTEKLSAYLRVYEAALASHNISRPYNGTIDDMNS